MTSRSQPSRAAKNDPHEPTRSNWNEGLWFIVAFGTLVFIQFRLTDAGHLFSRWFWHDEICTLHVVDDRSFLHSMQAIAAGVEGSPPGLQVLMRSWALVAGTSETAFRSFSFACMMLAVAGVYANLRRSFPRLVALAGALVVWAHPTILDQALQARFYAPWCAAVAWFAFFIGRVRTQRRVHWSDASRLACLSWVACFTHYFGVISLAGIVLAEWVVHGGPWRDWRVYASVGVGPVALIVSLPFFLIPQRAMSQVSSWAPSATVDEAVALLASIANPKMLYFLGVIVAVGLLLRGLGWLVRRGPERSAAANASTSFGGGAENGLDWKPLAPLAGIMLLVPALIVVSYVIQPCLVPRYSLPAVLGLAPIIAFAVSRTGAAAQVVAIAAMFYLACNSLHLHQATYRLEHADRLELVDTLCKVPLEQSILFELNHDAYVMEHYVPELAGRCYLADATVTPGMSQYRRWKVFQADHTRVVTHFYGSPQVLSRNKMDEMADLTVVIDWATNVNRDRIEPRYKNFDVNLLANRAFRLTRQLASSKALSASVNERNASEGGGGE